MLEGFRIEGSEDEGFHFICKKCKRVAEITKKIRTRPPLQTIRIYMTRLGRLTITP